MGCGATSMLYNVMLDRNLPLSCGHLSSFLYKEVEDLKIADGKGVTKEGLKLLNLLEVS